MFRLQEERERLAATRGAPTLDRNVAATQIQKVKNITKIFLLKLATAVHKTSILLCFFRYGKDTKQER